MIINLTPHTINIVTAAGVVSIQTSGNVARVSSQSTQVDTIVIDGNEVPVMAQTYGEVEGLPAVEAGTVFIVSGLVRSAANRADLVSPGELVRDGDGNVIGCASLVR